MFPYLSENSWPIPIKFILFYRLRIVDGSLSLVGCLFKSGRFWPPDSRHRSVTSEGWGRLRFGK